MPSFPFSYPRIMNLTPLVAGSAQFTNAINIPQRSGSMLVNLLYQFTLGSLTNVVLTAQVLNMDGSTWHDILSTATAALVANTNGAIPVIAAGAKQVRLKYLATGTATSSALIVDAYTQQ